MFVWKKRKGRLGGRPFLEKVFHFLWGVAKNYTMYWGFTVIIITSVSDKVCTKIYILFLLFCAGSHFIPFFL